jgi:hypothetical protein
MIEIFTQVVQGWRELGVVGLGALAAAFVVGAMVFAPRPPMCVVSGLVFGFIAFRSFFLRQLWDLSSPSCCPVISFDPVFSK